MSDELSVGISKPSYYKSHQNFVDAEWGVYETTPVINEDLTHSVYVDAYGCDAYGCDFEIDNVLLNAGWNKLTYTFDYQDIIDGYGKAHGLTAAEVIALFFDGYSFVDGYSFTLEHEIRYDIANRAIVSVDGNYYKEIRRSIDGYGTIESRTDPGGLFATDSNQQSVGFREEEISKNLSEGTHALKVDAIADLDDGTFIDGYGIRNFIIDNVVPSINIISPIAFDPTDLSTVIQGYPVLIYTIDGIENNPNVSLVNVEFQVDDGYGTFIANPDTSDGYGDGFGFMDGYGDRGRIPSGSQLNLRPGTYVMRIVAQDTAGNISSAFRRFSFNLPFSFDQAPANIWIGSDINGGNQSDSILEELMIRNTEITDDEAALDYVTGIRNLHFRTKEADRLIFTEEEEAKIRQLAIDLLTQSGELPNTLTSVERETLIELEIATIESHLNDTNRILLLSHFNVDIEPTEGAGELKKDFNPVVKSLSPSGRLQITILQKPSEEIDKDLMRDLIEKIKPAHVKAILKFEEVPE